ncbi:hypothetical protein BLNAU_1681 [Blattamonas nauphoetae]|uniref:Uncharacterized protein n=1 Tax=Blattamonas nauphoetae TaxID=2049346 RepID=A0ABQ9YHB3_9EUKA|nr:hypothetical protein BLNAU_1681 [Blattamonas nauphoetae]
MDVTKLPSSQSKLIQSGQFRLDAIDTMNTFAHLAPGLEPCQFPAGITDVDIQSFIENDSLTQTQFAQLKQYVTKEFELGTYDKDRVKALSVIQRHISAEANRLTKEKASMQHSLQVYRQIGMGFPALVQEYSNLLRQLEQQRWTLQQIAPQ